MRLWRAAHRDRALARRLGRRRCASARRARSRFRLTVPGGATAGGGRDHGQRAAPPTGGAGSDVDDAAAVGRHPRGGGAARRADRLRTGHLRTVRVRRGDPELHAEIDTSRVRLAVPDGHRRRTAAARRPRRGHPRRRARRSTRGRCPARPGCSRGGPAGSGCALLDPPSDRGAGRRRCSACSPSGTARSRLRAVRGQARLGPWPGRTGRSSCAIWTPSTRRRSAALWRFLFDIDLTSSVRSGRAPGRRPAAAPGLRRAAVRAAAARRAVRAARGGRRGAGGADVRGAGGCGVRGRGPVLPLERGALAALRRRQGRLLRAHRRRGRSARCRVRELGAALSGRGRRWPRWRAAGRVRETAAGRAGGGGHGAFARRRAPWLPHGF